VKPSLFIWIPKNAGSSIYYSLEAASTPRRSVKSCCHKDCINRIDGAHVSTFTHMSPEALIHEGYVSRSFVADRFTFAFVRNPWARMVSFYHYATTLPKMAEAAAAHCKSFAGMIEYIASGDLPPIGVKNWRGLSQANRQTDWLKIDGALFPDFIGRVETIREQWPGLCEQLGVKAELRHINKTKHGHYRDYYTPRTRDLMAGFCEEEIELFGYTF